MHTNVHEWRGMQGAYRRSTEATLLVTAESL